MVPRDIDSLISGAEEQKSLTGILESVAQEWADQLDQRGKPGGATLKEFRAALKDGAK